MPRNYLLQIAILIGFIFFFIGLISLSNYGKNWDETRRNYRGQAYLHFFLTGEKNYLNLSAERKSIYQFLGDEYSFESFVKKNEIGHPPFGDLLSSFSNYIFYQKLGILGDIEAYHLFIVFITAILVGLIFYFTAQSYGFFAGICATLSLVLYPLFIGESRFNFKDPVQASFLSICIIFFYWAIINSSWKKIIISAFFAAFAVSTKFNVFFSVFIVIPWLIVYHLKSIKKKKWPFARPTTISLIFYIFVPVILLYASWPYLWIDPVGNIKKVFEYYAFWGYGTRFQPNEYFVNGFNMYPLLSILYSTPLIILFLTFFGILYAISSGIKEKNKTSFLILFWFFVPIARVVMPNAGMVNGIREIMEYIPAMAILSGIGAWYIVFLSKKYFKKNPLISRGILIQLIILFSFIPITLKLISIHPNENVYFNPLVGGLKGAKEKEFWFWGNSFGNSYRQAANWLNKNAEPNAKVSIAVGYEGSIPRIWLRKDINYSNTHRKNFLNKNGEYIVEMTSDFPIWPQFCYWVYAKNILKPVYELKVDDVAILTIWKNDKDHTKPEYLPKDKASQVLANCVERNEYN